MKADDENNNNEQQQMTQTNRRPPVPPAGTVPWLIFLHGRRREKQTFFNIIDGSYQVRNIPEMRGSFVVAACQGWLVIRNVNSKHRNCFLLNINSMEKMVLPPWPENFYHDNAVLTLPPDHLHSLVVLQKRGDFKICRPVYNDKYWFEQRIDIGYDSIHNLTCFQGRNYILTLNPRRLLEFEVDLDTRVVTYRDTSVEPLELPKIYTGIDFRDYFVKASHELYIVRMVMFKFEENTGVEDYDFEVYKLDAERKIWVRDLRLDEGAILISQFCDACYMIPKSECVSSGLKPNTIYYLLPNDRRLYACDIVHNRVRVILPCPNIKTSYWSHPVWISPFT